MKTIRGHFDGSVVVLDDPTPQEEPAEVVVQFPERQHDAAYGASSEGGAAPPTAPQRILRGAEESRRLLEGIAASVSDELRRQRGAK